MISDYYRTAKKAVYAAAAELAASFGKEKQISHKSRIDLVTNVDYAAEKTILKILNDTYPDHDIITEESDIALSGSDYRWIIDPLDGTVNYAHDYPFFAVSIALEIRGTVELGIVYNPVMNEYFHALRGKGAFLNDNPISVSGTDDFGKSFLATGFPYDIKENPYNNIEYFNRLIMSAQAIRRDGSAALDLCYVAMGRFDGFWEIFLSPWDIAAGKLIIEEAGGKLTDFSGADLSIYQKEVIATNGGIHQQLQSRLADMKKNVYGR